jgi:MFS family permease
MRLDRQAIQRIKRALPFSTIEGMAYGGNVGLGEYFTGAYAVALGATNTQMALLTSLPNFVGALAQAPSASLARLLGSRKRVVIPFAILQGGMWLPTLAAGWVLRDQQAVWLIGFVVLYTTFGALVTPVWSSIMAEVVPRPLRGHYFGARTRWATLATVVTSLTGGSSSGG